MPIKSLAVFCGSKNGNNPVYRQHAAELAVLMVEHAITLVYGGGNVGIMGAVADEVMNKGGKVTGIIPQVLVEWERQHENITELIIVDDMHTRKRAIYDRSDAAVALPGGFGTLDELFEMLTWNQLSLHDKHIYILNSDGFYDFLVSHIERMKVEGFLYEKAVQRITIVNTPTELMAYLLA